MYRDQCNGRRAGFVLQEVMIALLVMAIACVPFFRAFQLLPEIGNALGQESRQEAWRGLAEQAVTTGIDPSHNTVLNGIAGEAVRSHLLGRVNRVALISRTGAAQRSVLSTEFANTPEARVGSGGFEIGASSLPAPPRVDPLPPLPTERVAAPTLTPASGSLFAIAGLSAPPVAGQPYLATISATGAVGTDAIHIGVVAPDVIDRSSAGSAAVTVTSFELAQSVRGRAWSEFPGNPATDIAVPLNDGRRLWLTMAADGRMQSHEPSDPVDFAYGINIGRPVYRVAGLDYPSGASIAIDYRLALSVESGFAAAKIAYPDSVMASFGNTWLSVAPAFVWVFGDQPGDSSAGDTRTFYGLGKRSGWLDSQFVQATPVTQRSGLATQVASWTVERARLTLGVPERASEFYEGNDDAAGVVAFRSPLLRPVEMRIGRPEINQVEALGETVSVPLIP